MTSNFRVDRGVQISTQISDTILVEIIGHGKGQLISKATYGLLTSPKKRMNIFFCLLFYSSRQTNQIRLFIFWENPWRTNLLFSFILPLNWLFQKFLILETNYGTIFGFYKIKYPCKASYVCYYVDE